MKVVGFYFQKHLLDNKVRNMAKKLIWRCIVVEMSIDGEWRISYILQLMVAICMWLRALASTSNRHNTYNERTVIAIIVIHINSKNSQKKVSRYTKNYKHFHYAKFICGRTKERTNGNERLRCEMHRKQKQQQQQSTTNYVVCKFPK